MSAADLNTLWLRLKEANLVEGELPPPSAVTAPWFVRVMLGVAGWMGAIFLLLFVGLGLSFVVESSGIACAVGLVACVAAGVLFHANPNSDFATQFGLAVSLAGQGLVLVALISWFGDEVSALALTMALFQAALFFLMSNFVHQVWSAWIGGSAVVLVLVDWKLQASAPGLLSAACVGVWGNEFLYARHGKILRAGGYGLVLALLGAVSVVAWSSEAWLQEDTPGSVYHLLIGAGLSGAVLLWAVWFLLNREAIHPATSTGRSLLAVASILTVATLKAPGLAPATLILLLGYGNGNRVLLGVGVVALLTYLSFYYYSLEMTLLHKSVLMMGTGLALLTARFLLGQWWPAPSQEKEHYA